MHALTPPPPPPPPQHQDQFDSQVLATALGSLCDAAGGAALVTLVVVAAFDGVACARDEAVQPDAADTTPHRARGGGLFYLAMLVAVSLNSVWTGILGAVQGTSE